MAKRIARTEILASVLVVLATGVFFPACSSVVSLKEDIENYFEEMRLAFEDVAKAPPVKGTKLSLTDRHFVSALKRHQTLYTLIRTNSKGVIISEVIRGEKPERNYRNIANQQWFSNVKERNEEYHGLVKDDDVGRYFLFWSKPVLVGKNRFIGAVVAKVDIWDSFHKFSADAEEPFLIRLGGKSLYSHKWKDTGAYDEENLVIPGIDKISVRALSAEKAAPETDVAITTPAPPVEPEPPVSEEKGIFSVLKQIAGNPVIISIIVVAMLVVAVFLIRLVVQINHLRLMRKVEKDSLF